MPQQEIRFAVVLYGGVSMAIYINGVVQELLRLVRATSGLQPRKPGTSESAYRKLRCLVERGALPNNDVDPGPADPINTRFRIDVISGRALWDLVELSVPRSLPALLARYWLSLLLLIAIRADCGRAVRRPGGDGSGLEPACTGTRDRDRAPHLVPLPAWQKMARGAATPAVRTGPDWHRLRRTVA
jgi:hypothetical protein